MPIKIIDPYATASSGEGHLNYAHPPPAPSAQTKGPNVINIFVPSEHTSLDYGAGKIPGVHADARFRGGIPHTLLDGRRRICLPTDSAGA